jgi:2-aminoadipate transaminase
MKTSTGIARQVSSPVTMASRIDRLASSAIGSVLRLADSADMIALAAGNPAPETFGADEVSEIMNRILTTPDPLQYGETDGMWLLREWIAANQSNLLGRDIGPARTMLTHGSQQALDLLCKALLDPGDVVLVDRPSYVGALQVFNLFQATLVPVPIVEDDNLDQLSTLLRRGLRPKLLYVVPNFANPTGLTVSAPQRERLVELATRHGFVVVEDDPYGELYYSDHDERPPAVAALSEEVVRIGSFSKVLFPAARLGYLTAPQPLVDVLIKLKQAADLVNSNLMQRIVYELVSTPGCVPDRLLGARQLYRERRDALVTSVRESLGDRLRFTTPEGGFFVWATLPEGASATMLLTEALAEHISFVPGQYFFAADPDDTTLRLSFSCATVEQLAVAGPRLANALNRVAG